MLVTIRSTYYNSEVPHDKASPLGRHFRDTAETIVVKYDCENKFEYFRDTSKSRYTLGEWNWKVGYVDTSGNRIIAHKTQYVNGPYDDNLITGDRLVGLLWNFAEYQYNLKCHLAGGRLLEDIQSYSHSIEGMVGGLTHVVTNGEKTKRFTRHAEPQGTRQRISYQDEVGNIVYVRAMRQGDVEHPDTGLILKHWTRLLWR